MQAQVNNINVKNLMPDHLCQMSLIYHLYVSNKNVTQLAHLHMLFYLGPNKPTQSDILVQWINAGQARANRKVLIFMLVLGACLHRGIHSRYLSLITSDIVSIKI